MDKILDRLTFLASAEDVRDLRHRVETLERDGSSQAKEALLKETELDKRLDTVERSMVSKGLIKWVIVQAIVMIGEGLGLVYALIPKK